ncbi:MAG: PEP-CTERM sorting domain-containing protein [Anaerolineae bacterium]|nr:PEP-CTERM sorting domain-containing protein [Gloeobacterales cyanobacterium ES-bin-313]
MVSTHSKIFTGLAALTLSLSSALPSMAATFAEGIDAGQTLGTAKVADSSAFGTPLDTITGSIAVTTGNADLYQIYLTGGTFSANTNLTTGTLTDTQLFLFNASGIGVVWDDDTGTALLSQFSISNVTAGIYYLGISGYNYDPISAGGQIFGTTPGGPTGVGGASPLTGWAFTSGTTTGSGPYTISLTGATFVPEPSEVLGLLAFAGLGGAAFMKRRKQVSA